MRAWKPIAHMNPDEIRRMQGRKLHDFVNRHLFPFSPIYRRRFDEAGVDPKSIRSVEDLQRLPLSSKADLVPLDNPKAYRDFILQPDREKLKAEWGMGRLLVRAVRERLRGRSLTDALDWEYRPIFLTATTGRSARQVPFLYTSYDLKLLERTGERLVALMQLGRDDRLVNLFPFAPHLAFWQVTLAGFAGGVFTLGTGGGKVAGTHKNIQTIQNFGATVVVGVPGYVYHLLREAAEQKADFSSVRMVVLGAEKVSPEQKRRMRALLRQMGADGVRILGTYGMTEARMAWIECAGGCAGDADSSGYHLYPDLGIFEVVDPETGRPVGEGETGELVYTPIDGRGSVVFRYRTGDIALGGITWQPCPHCGMTVPRVSSAITRRVKVEDLRLSKIKGTLVNLDDFGHVLAGCAGLEEWQVELRKRNNDAFELDEIVVYIAPSDGADPQTVREGVDRALRENLEVAPSDVIIEPLPRLVQRLGMETELKEKRVVDRREDADSRPSAVRHDRGRRPRRKTTLRGKIS